MIQIVDGPRRGELAMVADVQGMSLTCFVIAQGKPSGFFLLPMEQCKHVGKARVWSKSVEKNKPDTAQLDPSDNAFEER